MEVLRRKNRAITYLQAVQKNVIENTYDKAKKVKGK